LRHYFEIAGYQFLLSAVNSAAILIIYLLRHKQSATIHFVFLKDFPAVPSDPVWNE